MNLQKPDRVPLMCQFSIGAMMNQLHPDPVAFWYDQKTFADGLIELGFHFDGILVSLHGHSDYWKRPHRPQGPRRRAGRAAVSDRKELHMGRPADGYLPAAPPEQGHRKHRHRQGHPRHLDYIPVSHNLYFHLDRDNLFGIFDYLQEKTAGEYSIHGEITSPLDYFHTLGYENGLIAMMLDPEKCEKILAKYTVMIRIWRFVPKGIDAIKIFLALCRWALSRPILPPVRTAFRETNIQAIQQTWQTYPHLRVDISGMCESGLSGLECLDPPPVGNVDLEDAFNRVGDRIFIKGNIFNTLLLGEREGSPRRREDHRDRQTEREKDYPEYRLPLPQR